MAKRVGKKRRTRILRDILNSQHDLVALAEAHRLRPQDLAEWIAESDNLSTLAGLCILADLQTQLMLSRCRMSVAHELYRLATGGKDNAPPPEVTRRACVDLLKVDLKRADVAQPLPAAPATQLLDSMADELRDALYSDGDQNRPPDGAHEKNIFNLNTFHGGRG